MSKNRPKKSNHDGRPKTAMAMAFEKATKEAGVTEDASGQAETAKEKPADSSQWAKGVKPLSRTKARGQTVKASLKRKRNHSKGKPAKRKKAHNPKEIPLSALSVYHQTGAKAQRQSAPSPVATDDDPVEENLVLTPDAAINPVLLEDVTPFTYAPIATASAASVARAGTVDLVIGLDFGTSFTKVVVQEIDARRSWAIPFGTDECEKYLLPSTVFYGDAETPKLSLERLAHAHSNLKTPLVLRQGVKRHHAAIVVAFLALTLRHARLWIEQHAENLIARRTIQWHVRLGLPARNLEDAALVRTYHALGFAALALSFRPDREVDLNVAKHALGVALQAAGSTSAGSEQATEHSESTPIRINGLSLYPDQVKVVPELAAQITGYIRSDRWDRSAPKFMIIDVGGGTLDAAIFNVTATQSGQRRFSFFRSLVEPMGSLILHRERLDWLFNQVRVLQGESDLLGNIDILRRKESTQVRVLNKISQYLSGADFPPNDPDHDFYRRYSHLLWNDLIQVVRNKYDPDPRQWKGLALLFCGGGRNLSMYRQFVANSGTAMGSSVSFSEFENEMPSRMVAPDLLREDFHRLSVAYGLSFFDVGDHIPPDQIEPVYKIHTGPKPPSGTYISKDMM